MKHWKSVVLCSLFVILMLFSACSASMMASDSEAVLEKQEVMETFGEADNAEPMNADGLYMSEEPYTGSPDEPMPDNFTPKALENRKIIKHANLSLETKTFQTALDKIIQLVEAQGGYIENQTVDGRSLNNESNYYERSASIIARIPSEKLDSVTLSLGELCNIVSRNENIEDISDYYFDTQAHLETLNIQEERLLEILRKAEKLEDVITLEQALSEVRYQIESLTASIKRMDSQVAYSYLNINLQEVVEYQETISAPKTFGEKLSEAAKRSGKSFINTVQGIILFLVESGLVLILWIAILFGIFMLAYKLIRFGKRRKQKTLPLSQQHLPEQNVKEQEPTDPPQT